MPSINPYEGRRFVSLGAPTEHGIFEVTMESGATLWDMVSVVATMPTAVYIDHHSPTPGGTTILLRFRLLPAPTAR